MKKTNYTFLLQHYSRVNEYLSGDITNQEEFPDILISFCIVVEKILKIKLYKKNPILVFDIEKIKSDDSLTAVVLKKEKNIRTLNFLGTARRFGVFFRRKFSEEEELALLEIYAVRNIFIHSYKSDDKINFDSEDLLKKMGTIWEKISDFGIKLFGKEAIKKSAPKKKYTERELEKVLENEVKEMIKSTTEARAIFPYHHVVTSYDMFSSKEKCPRCGSLSFALSDTGTELRIGGIYDSTITGLSRIGGFGLYKCENCHLELTEKQYQIAKKL